MTVETTPMYPAVHVQLTGDDGNAFAILGRVRASLIAAGVDRQEVARYVTEATAGDYDHLLQVSLAWVSCG